MNVIDRYINYFNLKISRTGLIEDEHTINDFLDNIKSFKSIDDFANIVLNNRNRTSSNNGILKAEACKRVAKVFKINKINTLQDFYNCPNKEKLNNDILQIKGQSSGIMLKYLYMLVGDETLVKPDRWIERFIKDACDEKINQNEIQEIMQDAVNILKQKYQDMTVRKLDGIIWTYQTTKKGK